MTGCERHEVALSALVDGELAADEAAGVLDHVVGCATCREFYRAARALDARLLDARSGAPDGPAPESVWRRIEATHAAGPASRAPSVPRWPFAVAAAAVLTASVVALLGTRGPLTVGVRPIDVIVVEGDRGRMNDRRFLELTKELLKADRKYHSEMLRVLHQVSRGPGGEGPPEDGPDAVSPAEHDDETGSEGDGRTGRVRAL